MNSLRNLPIAAYNFPSVEVDESGNGQVWTDQPTYNGVILYSIVTPIICLFSIIGNGISVIVLLVMGKKPQLNRSIYTYLTVLAFSDFSSSIVIFVGGLCKGVLWWNGFGAFDALIGLPLGNFFNCFGVTAMVAVTWDRVIFLSKFERLKKLRLCRQIVARYTMIFSALFCILMNIPYCFIFNTDDLNNLTLTDFYFSTFYIIHSWFYVIVFGFLPLVLLIIGNGFLINYLAKAKRLGKKLNCKRSHKKGNGIIVTLIAMILCFLVSEIPAYLLSRTICASVLFNGDQEASDTKLIECLRQVCTILTALGALSNFLIFYFLCPTFHNAFRHVFCKNRTNQREITKRKLANVHLGVHVFIINKSYNNGIHEFAKDFAGKAIQYKYVPDAMTKI